jgi:hypothetical protein
MVKVGKRIAVPLDADQRALLDALSAKSGIPVAAMIRWCVTKSLPTLAGNIERSLAQVPNQSTIDVKPGS